MFQLLKPMAQLKKLKPPLSKYSYSDNKLYAVEKTLGQNPEAFFCQCCVYQFEQSNAQLIPTA
jgi:hypothetical protein